MKPSKQQAATCSVAAQGDEGGHLSQPHLTPPAPPAASRPATCCLCGQPVGDRDFPAVWPFDSECGCPSPFRPVVVEEELPVPNERWFAQQRRAAP